ncbi:MAG: DEAD/DEAH box helicase [Planctomycetes bacterium]|nr:DEAD/DEAH box helicase [Planctomycetota bacterium]
MPTPANPNLVRQLAEAEARLLALEADVEATRREVERLRGALKRREAEGENDDELSPHDKVVIFRSLFRGRTDLFPRRWVNERDGRHGYAPVCTNEWVADVCQKPRVKCGACPHAAFLPLDDRAIVDHLQGRHVLGIYPMLPDHTCWLVAIDLDGDAWRPDAEALIAIARAVEVPFALERSRSGNGAHLWVFFSETIDAREGRELARALVAAAARHAARPSLPSVDRFFPAQDRLSSGGFGSLIALPLQLGPRQHGNTVFIDDRLEPHDDPWRFLLTVDRLSAEEVRARIVRLRAEPDAPRTIPAVLESRLSIPLEPLPKALAVDLRRVVSFPNPEYQKKRRLRMNTAFTPKVIDTTERSGDHLLFPRGCTEELVETVASHGSTLQIDDRRFAGASIDARFRGELTEAQSSALTDLLAHEDGLFVAPPGTGKTVLGAAMIAARGRNALVIVHRKPLLEQWIAQLRTFLEIEEPLIGRIGGGRREATGVIDVAMIQSLARGGEIDPALREYGHIVVDECHHCPARTFESVLAHARARYFLGLTATPERRDGLHPITRQQLGPIRHRIEPKSQAAARPFDHELHIHHTAFAFPQHDDERPSINDLYAALTADEARNTQILDDVITALEAGRSPILLTERRDHLAFFAEALEGVARNLVVLHGGRQDRERLASEERLRAIPTDEERLVIATGRYIGEGFDDARLDTLFLTLPISWKGTLVQYAGRLHRKHRGKTVVEIHDYVDAGVPMLARMFQRRRKGYRALGYRESVVNDSANPLPADPRPE